MDELLTQVYLASHFVVLLAIVFIARGMRKWWQDKFKEDFPGWVWGGLALTLAVLVGHFAITWLRAQ